MITQILHHQTRRINMEFQKLIEERRTIRKYSPYYNQGGTGSTKLEELPDRKILLCDI